ncbi:MAG: EamA family transporter RarD [Desulfohalobiaceae bacterium]
MRSPQISSAVSWSGLFAGTGAFFIWGVLPVYWKALGAVPAAEILCHRIVWSFVFVALTLSFCGRWQEVQTLLRSGQSVVLLVISSLLLSVNWFTYIWGVNAGFVLEASLGYYINPLVNVLLGCLVFKDRLRLLQVLAILFAAAGVMNMILNYGRVPWIALILAFSFGMYGLIRKVVHTESLPGLWLETAIMGGPALGYLLLQDGLGSFASLGLEIDMLLAGAGLVTSLPLLFFAFSARRLRLVEVGILQYIAPTCMFLLGLLVYKEPFNVAKLLSFILIWSGIAIYMAESIWYLKRIKCISQSAS